MVMCVPRRGECLYLAAWCVCPPYVPEKRPPTHTRDVIAIDWHNCPRGGNVHIHVRTRTRELGNALLARAHIIIGAWFQTRYLAFWQ